MSRMRNINPFSPPVKVRIIPEAIRSLNELRVTSLTDLKNPRSWGYNCWSCTAQVMGWVEDQFWMSQHAMKEHLAEKTVPILKKDARAGDIVVFFKKDDDYSYGYDLYHTAVIIEKRRNPIVLHKDGENAADVVPLTKAGYRFCKIKYVRPLHIQ